MDERQDYRAVDGVEWVSGRRVPANRIVRLSAAEARFDLDRARIVAVLKAERTAGRKRRRAPSGPVDLSGDEWLPEAAPMTDPVTDDGGD